MTESSRHVIVPGYTGLERRAEPCGDVHTDCESRFEFLEQWQIRQNGSLERIEKKVDKLLFAIIACLGTVVVSLGLLVFQLMKG